jgi:hypothetical protein
VEENEIGIQEIKRRIDQARTEENLLGPFRITVEVWHGKDLRNLNHLNFKLLSKRFEPLIVDYYIYDPFKSSTL